MYGCRCCTSLFQYRMLVSLLGGDVVLAPRNNVMIPSNHIPKQACIQKAPGHRGSDDPELSLTTSRRLFRRRPRAFERGIPTCPGVFESR